MKKIFFKLSISAFSFAIISVLGIVISTQSSKPAILNADGDGGATETAPDFTGEVEFNVGDMSVNATSSSQTNFSTSYQITYSTGGKAIVDNALGGSFVNVIGDVVDGEDALIKRATEIHNLPADEQEAMHYLVEIGELETELYDGHVFRFNSQKTDVFVPETISRGTYDWDSIFDVNVVSILDNAFTSTAFVEKLYIPDTVEVISAEAFVKAPNLSDIYVEFNESDIPVGWAEGWNAGKTVHYGIEDIYSYAPISSQSGYRHPSFTQFSTVGDDSINYMFGYVPRDESKGNYPITVEYKLIGANKIYFLPRKKFQRNFSTSHVKKSKKFIYDPSILNINFNDLIFQSDEDL